MKKIILMFLFILLISGCNAEYEITINSKDRIINDSLKISNLDKSMNVEEIMTKNIGVQYYENYVMFSSVNSPNKKYYNKTFENNLFSLSNNSTIYEFGNSAIVKSCFDNYVVSEDYYDIYLTASGFNCFNKYQTLEEVKFKIVIDSAIVSTNLEKLDLNTYSKIITRQNANEEINFIFPLFQVPVNKVIYRGEGDGDGGTDIKPTDEISSQDDNQSSQEDNSSSQDDNQSSQEDNNSSQDENSSFYEDSNESKTKSNLLIWIILVIIILSTIGIFIFIKNKKNNKI